MKYDLFPPPMRTAVVLALGLFACANRGMRAPDGGADRTGSGGRAGTTGSGGGSGSGGIGGAGSGGSNGCTGDGGTDSDAGTCAAFFNFEGAAGCALYGATLNDKMYQLAFQSISNSGAQTFCGQGALEITASFSGTGGTTTKGELFLPFTGSQDLTGKTVTIHVLAVPPPSNLTKLSVIPVTSAGYYPQSIFTITPITAVAGQWTTKSFTFGTGADAGAMMVNSFSVQVSSVDGYVGQIYIDEIDIKAAPPPTDASTQ
jgi:hypothetical protein